MNKINIGILFLLLIWGTENTTGQNLLFEGKLDYEGLGNGVKDLQICREGANRDLAVFLYSDLDNYAILFDSNYAEKTVLFAPKPRLFFSTNIGQIYKNNKYISFYTDGTNNKLSAHTFDFVKKQIEFESVKLPFVKSESVLSTFTTNGRLYFVTLMKGTSKIGLYEYSTINEVSKVEFKFDDKTFPHFLGDNLYNCIAHDELRPVNTDYLYDYTFSDKEDYLLFDKDNIHIICNTNTVITINLNSKKTQISEFSKLLKKGKVSEMFKSFTKDNRTRSIVLDSNYFRASENIGQIGIEVFNLYTQDLLLDTVFYKSEFLEFPLTTDRAFRKKIVKMDSFKSLLKGKMAFRVFREDSTYILNIGRDFDRLFELDNGYFELNVELTKSSMFISDPELKEGKLNTFRIEGQNLNYEFEEIIFRDKTNDLKFIQYNKKDKTLKIMN